MTFATSTTHEFGPGLVEALCLNENLQHILRLFSPESSRAWLRTAAHGPPSWESPGKAWFLVLLLGLRRQQMGGPGDGMGEDRGHHPPQEPAPWSTCLYLVCPGLLCTINKKKLFAQVPQCRWSPGGRRGHCSHRRGAGDGYHSDQARTTLASPCLVVSRARFLFSN